MTPTLENHASALAFTSFRATDRPTGQGRVAMPIRVGDGRHARREQVSGVLAAPNVMPVNLFVYDDGHPSWQAVPVDIREALEGRQFGRVAVIASGASASEVRTALVPADDIFVLASASPPDWQLGRSGAQHILVENLSEVNWQLKRLGPFDAIIDVSDDVSLPHDKTWAFVFLHLSDGGSYLSSMVSKNPLRAHLVSVLAGEGEGWAPSAIDAVTFADNVIILAKRGTHYLKLRDYEVDRFLPTRDVPATSEVLSRIPAGQLAARTRLFSHTSGVPHSGLETTMAYPELRMRHYTGEIAMATHSLLFTQSTLLPETYRHHLHKRLNHTRSTDCTAQFATIADEHVPTDRLEGNYYFLDSPFPGHFGHVTTEAISRLWGWDEAKRRIPDLKAIWRIRDPNDHNPQLERELYGAYGIAERDMLWVDRPVWLESVVGVTPMWHNQFPHYVHPDMAKVWDRIAAGLADTPVDPPSRVFVSRRAGLVRSCRNAAEVEAVFERHGFVVVYPEELTLSQQAGVFRAAEVVAGFGGSAMFNVMYCANLRNLIVLTHEAYTARNEYMFASVLGGRTDYFWSRPDTPHPIGGWTQAAFTSGWEFDFGRNRRDLENLLGSLGPGVLGS
ncbi:MAG: glycosyltransferase 61 family protein [Terracoccus sp.]